MAKKKDDGRKIIAENRKARYNFFIEETLEAGIMLVGTEVKGLRTGQTSIGDAYAGANAAGGLWLYNVHIPEYRQALRDNHEPRRPRKLLLRTRELRKLTVDIQRGGMTLIPLSIYFNERGMAKIELGLAKGKKLHDKRQSEKERDWNREKARVMRDKG